LSLAAAFAVLLPAAAQDMRSRQVGQWVITKAQANKTDCSCRMRGQDLPVGSEVCMHDAMFRCQMNQNVTTWSPLASPCPQS
jgi:hypothetical protein